VLPRTAEEYKGAVLQFLGFRVHVQVVEQIKSPLSMYWSLTFLTGETALTALLLVAGGSGYSIEFCDDIFAQY